MTRLSVEDTLHDARIRLTEIIQDHRSGMPLERVLDELATLAGKLQSIVIHFDQILHLPPR